MASNFKSAFESVPGRDALLQYEEKNYPNRTYVERNGLIFKSLTATSENFVLSQWELIGDLREVRVPNIAARNSLTGTTGTSYGVHTPILDNTNVLVLDASADPQVGTAQFARYNYNQGSASWLLLQVGTGSTSASTSIEYSNVLNRPFIVSGVTVNAGAGLAGGGSVFGSIPAAGGIINLAHADTSSQVNLTPTGRTYIQQLRFDTYGHVTGATQSTWTHPATSSQANVLNTGRTYIQSISLDANGHITNISSSPWTHPDTSTQANSINTGNTFIQSIYLDGDGHIIGLGTGVAAGGGGGGSPLTFNGNSGGALTMNSGATLNITGGTNILTVRTGNAANPGLRINVNPSGLNGQVQYNSAGALGASANFVFSAATSTLRTNNYVIGAAPAVGNAATDQYLTRNITTGAVQRVDIASIATEVFATLPSLGNILYVSVSGNNLTAVPGNITKPYQTIQTAISAANTIPGKSATNRALVYVLPGNHSISFSTTMANFVDLYFTPGAILTAASATAFSYNNVDSNIYGHGTFSKTVAAGDFITVANCKQPNNKSMIIEGAYSSIIASSGRFINVTNSNIHVKFDTILVNGNASYGNFSTNSDATLEFDEFTKSGSTGANVVSNGNGGTSKFKMYGKKVRTEAFFFQNYLGDSELYVDDINCSGSGVIDFRSTSRTKFRGRINHTGIFAPLSFTDATAKAYIMPGTCIITSFTYSVNSFAVPSGAPLYVYDSFISNKPVNAAKVTTMTGTVTVDASIDF